MDETTLVTMVGLYAVGKVGAPALEVLKNFLGQLFGPAVNEAGQALADPIRAWRARRQENAVKLVGKAAEMVEASGREPHQVPGRLLLPIIERGSIEEDPDLQQTWAALLANAAIDETVLPSYAEILSQLTPLDARVLRVFSWRLGSDDPRVWAKHRIIQYVSDNYGPAEEARWSKQLGDEYQVRMENLHRLGLIYPEMRPQRFVGIGSQEVEEGITLPLPGQIQYLFVGLTKLGAAFIKACTPPKATAS